jgi:glutaminyl-peptide cyclotransferase
VIKRALILLWVMLSLGCSALATAAQDPEAPSGRVAPVSGYQVVAEFPHDPEAFTQGLVYEDNGFLEGTGLKGESTLRRVRLETGEVEQSIDLHDVYFGEGIAVVEDRVYQLTYRNEVCFVYDRSTFERTDIFFYNGEGWGLAYDGTELIMSDGSSSLVFRDPETFRIVREVEVLDGDQPVELLNELEWIDGEVWANVWQTDWIVRIDPDSGAVVGWIDMAGLLPDNVAEDSVGPLNGIAHDAETRRIFVTGKLWPVLFEIEVVERQ